MAAPGRTPAGQKWRPDTADEEVQLLTKRLTPGLAGYPVLIIAGLFIPVVAVIGYLAVALYDIIPFRSGSIPFRRRRPPQPGAGLRGN